MSCHVSCQQNEPSWEWDLGGTRVRWRSSWQRLRRTMPRAEVGRFQSILITSPVLQVQGSDDDSLLGYGYCSCLYLSGYHDYQALRFSCQFFVKQLPVASAAASHSPTTRNSESYTLNASPRIQNRVVPTNPEAALYSIPSIPTPTEKPAEDPYSLKPFINPLFTRTPYARIAPRSPNPLHP